MLNSIKSTYKQYAIFYGRENRRTYLEFFFFQIILSILATLIVLISWAAAGWTLTDAGANQGVDGLAFLTASFWGLFGFAVLGLHSLIAIGTFVPWLALQSRRLHDANFSAWWLLLHLLPFGTLALFIMNCFNSVVGESAFENEGRPRSASNSGSRTTNPVNNSSDEW
jgi:uncharacterized membrane protein YhaH (DUF805 family)